MRCFGITRKIRLCQNRCKFILCHQHRNWKQLLFWLVLFGLPAIGIYAGLFQDLIVPTVNFIGKIHQPQNKKPDTKLLLPTLDESQKVKNALRKTLLYELELYKYPDEFDETELSKYWVSIENGGKAIKRVLEAINRLKRYKLYYGAESRYEKLTFDSVEIHSNKYADVQATEIWYFPVYDSQGERTAMKSRYENLNYTYTLRRKLNGKWLLYSTTVDYYGDKFTEYPLKEKATD